MDLETLSLVHKTGIRSRRFRSREDP